MLIPLAALQEYLPLSVSSRLMIVKILILACGMSFLKPATMSSVIRK